MSHIHPQSDPNEALEAIAIQFKEQLRVEVARIGQEGQQEVAARQILAGHLQITDRMLRNYLKSQTEHPATDISFRTLYLAVKHLGFLFEHDGVIFGRMIE